MIRKRYGETGYDERKKSEVAILLSRFWMEKVGKFIEKGNRESWENKILLLRRSIAT